MNKKLFKKVLTAVLTAALLFTSNGIASLNASAAEDEKILVEGVYTNFQKATMATQTTRQINAYVEPGDATNQSLRYKSSDTEVAKVSATGLITALSPGKATITVSALDGSRQIETIKITVLKDLTITNKNVDSDNEVIVLDKSLGNLYIDSSVGDADIYLSGVTVSNILALDSGDYSLYMYDSTAKELKIDEIAGEIESFATDEEEAKAPSLVLGENTTINDLNARISASIRQEDGSAIEGLRVTQTEDGKITIYLENYNGGLLLDASLGDLEIVTTGCNLSNVNVSGNENAGNVTLTDGGDSEIANLTVSGAANVNLGVPATEVNIDKNANGASFSSTSSIGTLRNAGNGSNITISGEVNSLEANGEGARINVAAGGYVGTANLNGAGSTLFGAGDVSEANINANNISVDTVNTLVTVGPVTGAKVQGSDASPDSTVATRPITGGGGGGASSDEEVEIVAGLVILDNDFEDGINGLAVTMGSGTVQATIVDDGKDSNKALRVTNRTSNYFGVGYNFINYLDNRATVRIKFDIKSSESAVRRGDPNPENNDKLKATMKTNIGSGYLEVASKMDYDAGVWYTMEGTFELGANVTEAILYIEAPVNVTYYLDNVEITVDRIGDPVAATSVTLSDGDFNLNINGTKKLTATVLPDNAEDMTVTWTSSDSTVATVDTDGIVKGLKAGTATVTATSNCPYAEPQPSASVEVTVLNLVTIDLDRNYVLLTTVGQKKALSAGATATWTSDKPAVATVDSNGLVSAVGNGTATITAVTATGIGTCTVNVTIQPEGAIVLDFDDETAGATKSMMGSGTAKIINDPTTTGSTNKVLKVETVNGYSEFPYFEITLPTGKKLSDYSSLEAKVQLISGDTNYKSLRVWAGKVLGDITVGYSATPSQIGASGNKSGSASFELATVDFTTMSSTIRNYTGSIVLGLGFMADPGTVYAIDEIILVPFTGEKVAITGITLNKSEVTLVEGKTEQLTATIAPTGYTTDGKITWSSSEPTVATVDATGKVTALKEGTATITAKTAIDAPSLVEYSATCTVTVDPKPVVAVPGFEDFELMSVGTTLPWVSWGGADTATVIVDPNNPANKLLEVKPVNFNGAPIVEITLADGKTLSDYSHIKFKALYKEGDIGWKNFYVEADTILSGALAQAEYADRQIATYYKDSGATTVLEEKVLTLNGNKGGLSGTIQIALGISCDGSADGKDTLYYLDDIELVPKTAPEFTIDFNSVDVGTSYKKIAWDPGANSALVVAVSGSAIRALEVRPTNYNTAAVIPVTIPEGFTLGDYKEISIKALWVSGDVGWKDVIIEAATELTGAFVQEGNEGRQIALRKREAGTNTVFEEFILTLNGTNATLSGDIEIAIGISCEGTGEGNPTVYMLDDIKFIPKD